MKRLLILLSLLIACSGCASINHTHTNNIHGNKIYNPDFAPCGFPYYSHEHKAHRRCL